MSTYVAFVPFFASALLALLSADGRRERLFRLTKPATTLFLLLPLAVPRGLFSAAVAVGLALSALGDLALLGRGDKHFLAGVAFFLLAHLAYIVAFTFGVSASLSSGAIAVGAVVLAVTAGLLRALWSHVASELRVAVGIYGAVIATMLIASLRLIGSHIAPSVAFPAFVGATLFYLSDAVLAWTRFRQHLPYEATLNLVLYWAGQCGLAIAASASEHIAP